MPQDTESALFDTAFRARAPHLGLRAEDDKDGAFLAALFVACSPLAGMLPPEMMAQQAAAKEASYRANRPEAMRRIVAHEGAPVGRIAIDWRSGTGSYCIDVAVLPTARGIGAGGAMLRTWLEVADATGRPATLDVLRDSPVVDLYRKLGFETVLPDESGPGITMRRPIP
jgi:GNAT superfamily N-acetyltransferase